MSDTSRIVGVCDKYLDVLKSQALSAPVQKGYGSVIASNIGLISRMVTAAEGSEFELTQEFVDACADKLQSGMSTRTLKLAPEQLLIKLERISSEVCEVVLSKLEEEGFVQQYGP